MTKPLHRVLAALVVLVFIPLLYAAETPRLQPKQLAGPPSEFSQMQLAAPEVGGIRSHSALIPVRLVPNRNNQLVWQAALPVEDGSNFRMLVLSGTSQWQVDLQSETARRTASAHDLAVEHQETSLKMSGEEVPAEFFAFENLTPGSWTVTVTGTEKMEHISGIDGFLLISDESPYRAYSHLTDHRLLVGSPISLSTRLIEETDHSALPVALPDTIFDASMVVTTPSGKEITVVMNEGLNGAASASFIPDEPGNHHARVTLQGVTPEGRPFIRTTQHLFPVINPYLELAGSMATLRQDGDRLAIDFGVSLFDNANDHFRVHAELWGHDASGNPVSIAWLGGMVYPEGSRATLGLDQRWLSRVGARAPFTLKNLRIQDPDSHVPLVTGAELTVRARNLPSSFAAFRSINNTMLMGPRPEVNSQSLAGGKLLLVHGFCSGGGSWPSGDFADYAVFSDPNQNRSHDQFAQLIANFGAQFPSFGIVAHSQGGAAALHLYTYYWSGLDYSAGNRLVQSVGTPYQGTSLAGAIAALGAIFGISCGSNTDLTYNGASSWLSGIPSWARGKVHYYTTSFDDVWWRWDYCHIASDLLLSDPDDGTTEKWSGQLSGANNRGHKTDWCHTGGMRDPAQTGDRSRNVDMSNNAAR